MIPGALVADFRRTLFAGGYNLLLGAGISLSSANSRGEDLAGVGDLQNKLCELKGVPRSTSLSRVTGLLTDDERRIYLTESYQSCTPSPRLKPLTEFLWRRLFTFNIDDVIENLYQGPNKQHLITLNHNSAFEPTPERDRLQAVHLHGWVGQPSVPYVFSRNDYARITRGLNPWMHLLSQILSTESFIIAGTSLDESDLEYYLSTRSEETPMRSRGPSLLIDPFPNPATERECERHGLVLIPAKFEEFLAWLIDEFPNAPTVAELLVPDTTTLFVQGLPSAALLRFFSDFRPVPASNRELSSQPSRFLYGREPTWADIDEHVDIERSNYLAVSKAVERAFNDHRRPKLILIADDPGTGKTTATMRVAHDNVLAGRSVLEVSTASRIDVAGALACLSTLRSDLLIHVDGLADHAEQILELIDSDQVTARIVVIASERSYRMDFLMATFAGVRMTRRGTGQLSFTESRQLLERYRSYGLIASQQALANPGSYARLLQAEPIAIAICHILDDYKPMQAIVESLWTVAPIEDKRIYLATSLAHHCYSQGVSYGILQEISGVNFSVSKMFQADRPLRLVENSMHDEYVLPIQSVIAERLLLHVQHNSPELLFEAFVAMAAALSPHVNRRAVMRRTPEARLAGRLFDSDKVVKPFLKERAEHFYLAVKEDWSWNSRYWEQRALLVADSDVQVAVRHARHAVATERHPHTLTTLGKILFMAMDADPRDRVAAFSEGFEVLSEAIRSEVRGSRITIHPYAALFGGVLRYLQLGMRLPHELTERLQILLIDSNRAFPHDAALRTQEHELARRLTD